MGQTENPAGLTAVVVPVDPRDRRHSQRARISKPVRVRPSDATCQEEVQTTLNASRDGLYFTTSAKHYFVGMRVRVIFPYAPADLCNSEYFAEIVRMERVAVDRLGIGVRFVLR